MRSFFANVAFFAAVLGGVYFLYQATAAAAVNAFHQLAAPSAWLFVILASLIFAFSYLPSALIWRRLLLWRGIDVHASESLALLVRTAPAKYLPGNIAQPIGRAAGLASRGTSLSAVLATLFEEAVISLGAAGSLALLVGLLVLDLLPLALSAFLPWLLLGASTLALAFLVLLSINSAPQRWLLRLSPVMQSARIVVIGGAYAVVMMFVGTSVAVASLAITPFDVSKAALVFFAFLVSWVLGSLVPGAPAGLGVRDGAMVWILTPCFAETAVVIAAIARLATILGDAVAFLVGLSFLSHHEARGS